jgi:hypothetical protein
MNLLCLAPDIQEEILFLPPAFGRGPITERPLRRLKVMVNWSEQRQIWGELRRVSATSLGASAPSLSS